ncbi:hypothetical protein EKE94_12180 [Mesobaculum littorinae]|uniref:Endonuclease n=1 Tax=Mesobaculum littorinae TaxID=2486419 RepID=A0A438AHQ7_9RHOB|nr:hypothetical protein [Mesobaculum littorinae]RVV98194.1 hypothetical protein EKE94_12180 [Mesobaculum littorinae]
MGQGELADILISSQGRLYSEDMGANIARDVPQQWFHWLVGALLMSARISAAQAVKAAAALKRHDLHKIDGILASTRASRIRVLNRNGYARFDNQGADYLHDAARLVRDRWSGDLRHLRDEAETPQDLLQGVQAVKGIGATGAGIFAREAQMVWPDLHPFATGPALTAARDLGLPDDAKGLARLAGGPERMARLVAGLTRAALDGPSDAVAQARG